MTHLFSAVLHALELSGIMGWDILWGLSLGFLISAVVDVAVSKNEMGRLMPDASVRSIGIATGLGACSSSCSYAAVAMARSIFRKGGNFTASMAFQFAATNLVIELGILLALVLGWQFTLAEFIGGPLMIAILVLLFRFLLRPTLVGTARKQAARGLRGSMESHAMMAAAKKSGGIWQRIISRDGLTEISHYFVMNWQMLWKDILAGLLIAGAAGAWIPRSFWEGLFLSGHHGAAAVWDAVVGPFVAILSFVCSIGNVPFALILWKGGISFGGIVAFIFADLIILPILNIYRKYYGGKMAGFLFVTFYVAMVASALVIEVVFRWLGLVPQVTRTGTLIRAISLNYTTLLNVLFLLLTVFLVVRFMVTGGPEMTRRMRTMDHDGKTEHRP